MDDHCRLVMEIVTITLNPAIDQTVFLHELRPGEVNRAYKHHRQAGGKGVNVSRMLGAYGIPNRATGFIGQENPKYFEEAFTACGVEDHFIRIAGETRTGIKIISDQSQQTTDLNFAGLSPTVENWAALLEKLRSLAEPGLWFVIGGRLPEGVSDEQFRSLLMMLRGQSARIAVDTSGDALKTAIDCQVDLIKPNVHELEEILGRRLRNDSEAAMAAYEVQKAGVERVILSLGEKGALFLSPQSLIKIDAPPAHVVSTVGAGDALLAGYMAGMSCALNDSDSAKLATVFAWSALENVARDAPTPAMVGQRIRELVEHNISV